MSRAHVDAIVVGAGVIGLATARILAKHGLEVVLLEAEAAIGQHCSTRNSQVIHAGIYYPSGSAQARLCLKGREMLYDYCASRNVTVERCGKLIVATDRDQLSDLSALYELGRENGVYDLAMLDASAANAHEPAVNAIAAISSPSSGIIDAPGLMLSLLGEAEGAGAMLALNAPFVGAQRGGDRFMVSVGGNEPMELTTDHLINAAGLGAWQVAAGVKDLPLSVIPPMNLAKGHYFALPGKSPFCGLVYPMPNAGSLGIHSVKDLAGGVRFGPDMNWQNDIEYSVDDALREKFETAVRRYWPDLPRGSLQPESAGIRPRISGVGQPKRVFEFQGEKQHGVQGLIQLFGFESPGLTACLAIAEQVRDIVKGDI